MSNEPSFDRTKPNILLLGGIILLLEVIVLLVEVIFLLLEVAVRSIVAIDEIHEIAHRSIVVGDNLLLNAIVRRRISAKDEA